MITFWVTFLYLSLMGGFCWLMAKDSFSKKNHKHQTNAKASVDMRYL